MVTAGPGAGTDFGRLDLERSARGALLNGVTGGVGALVTFVATVLVARDLSAAGAGAFFESLAIFAILTAAAVWGADYGLTRFLSGHEAVEDRDSVWPTLVAGVTPVALAGSLAAVVAWYAAPDLGQLFSRHVHGVEAEVFVTLLRSMSPFILVAAVARALVAATRSYRTMIPTIVCETLGSQLLRLLAVGLVVTVGPGSPLAVGLAWGGPSLLSLVGACWFVHALLPDRTAHRTTSRRSSRQRRRDGAKAFWSFTAYRGLASVVQLVTIWTEVLLLGAFGSERQAGVYGAVSRYALVGTIGLQAALLVVGPEVARLGARKDTAGIEALYQTMTAWLISAILPVYLLIAIFPGLFLGLFGAQFRRDGASLTILCLFMLINVVTGPASIVLLMLGHSSSNLLNAATAMAVSIGLSIVLIPSFGVAGAALSWGAAIVFENVLPVYQIWRRHGLHPVGGGFRLASTAALGTVGVAGGCARLAGFSGSLGLLAAGLVGGSAFTIIAYRHRQTLKLDTLWVSLARRSGRQRVGD